MSYLEEHILYLDIGAIFLKILLIKVTWKKIRSIILQHKILSQGINIYGIENFELLDNNIKRLIYEIEYESSVKVTKIFLIYSCFAAKYITFSHTSLLKQIITLEDIKKLHRKNNIQNKDKILHYNYFFLLDHSMSVFNPLSMVCNSLTIRQNYFIINKILYENINLIFTRNNYEILNNFSGLFILSEYIRNYYHNFIIIDGGYYSTRICLVENNILREIYTLNYGIYHLLQTICLKYKIHINDAYILASEVGLCNHDNIDILKINQLYMEKIIKDTIASFKNHIIHILDIPIFINGWSFLHSLEYFVQIKYQRNTIVTSNYFNFPHQFEYLYALYEILSKNT
jgi:cell division ATPase FtsA